MKRDISFITALGIALLIGLLAMPIFAWAQCEEDESGNCPSEISVNQLPAEKDTYGTVDFTTQNIKSGGFTPIRSTYTYDQNHSWRWSNTGGWSWYDASFVLPNGAQILGLDLEAYDNDGAQSVYWALQVCGWLAGTCTYYTDDTVGTPGYTGPYMNLAGNNIYVNNFWNTYSTRVRVAGNGNTRFRTVGVRYILRISPDPPWATFWDVPIGAPFHREIEALADSGITTGFGDGSYRPLNPVTRGQMAAFLARAMGLHFPY